MLSSGPFHILGVFSGSREDTFNQTKCVLKLRLKLLSSDGEK